MSDYNAEQAEIAKRLADNARAELRDRFAMAALTGFLAEPPLGNMSSIYRVVGLPAKTAMVDALPIACYAVADAMLAARERKP